MAEEITREMFDHLVHLAQFELSEEEAEYLRRELNRQLDAIHKLEAIPLEEDVPITSHGVPYRPEDRAPLREDEVRPYPHPERLRDLAPEEEDGYFVVPDTRRTEALTGKDAS